MPREREGRVGERRRYGHAMLPTGNRRAEDGIDERPNGEASHCVSDAAVNLRSNRRRRVPHARRGWLSAPPCAGTADEAGQRAEAGSDPDMPVPLQRRVDGRNWNGALAIVRHEHQAVGLVPHHGAAQPALSEEVDSDGAVRLQARQCRQLRSGGRRRTKGERVALGDRRGRGWQHEQDEQRSWSTHNAFGVRGRTQDGSGRSRRSQGSLDTPTVPSGPLSCSPARLGQVAQLVEQRTENPRVGGSIPPLATCRATS